MKPLILVSIATLLMTACQAQNPTAEPAKQPVSPSQAEVTGTERGNGTDYLPIESGSAWFAGGNKTVRYCVEIGASFGRSEKEIKQAIESAFDSWGWYMYYKKIGRFLASKYIASENCSGNEDLTFYFGIKNSEVNAATAKYNNPVALAVRTQYDLETGWGRGFIWVAPPGSIKGREINEVVPFPNWTHEGNLEGIILHELGHVFGCEHVPYTIMDELMYQRLHRDYTAVTANGQTTISYKPVTKERIESLTSIDNDKELSVCITCDISYVGRLGYYHETVSENGTEIIENQSKNFEVLFGSKPKGNPKNIQARIDGNHSNGYTLSVNDGAETHSLELKVVSPALTSIFYGRSIFKTILMSTIGNTTSIQFFGSSHNGITFPLEITTNAGEKLTLYVERNTLVSPTVVFPSVMYSSTFTIKYFRNNETEYLFLGKIWK
jgi:hypothetical protein